MAQLSLPYPTFTVDEIADAAEVTANFAAVVAMFAGGIADDNVSTNADLDGNKLSQTAGKRVPETRLENNAVSNRVLAADAVLTANILDDAVTAAKLADHATIDGNRAVTTNHVRDLNITKAKLAAGAASLDKTGLIVQVKAVQSATITAGSSLDVTPNTPIPTATQELIALYLDIPVSLGVDRPLVVHRKTSAPNYIALLHNASAGSVVVGGAGTNINVVFVSIART